MIETGCSNGVEVALIDPMFPMMLKSVVRFLFAQGLSIGIFVHDAVTMAKQRRSDPWFEDKPTT